VIHLTCLLCKGLCLFGRADGDPLDLSAVQRAVPVGTVLDSADGDPLDLSAVQRAVSVGQCRW